ncbi:MAG: general secretion pathway protein GspK [Gemmatimonadaceae bacterium]|nr:general secretion pathway protein GspK [Gemmatimonadaceae bacterium]
MLWVVSMMAVATAAAVSDARRFTDASSSRDLLLAAHWELRGCLAVVRAELHVALRDGASLEAAVRRVADGRGAPTLRAARTCDVSFQPGGVSLPHDLQDEFALATYFNVLGYGSRSVDFRDALLDWTDTDERPRARGAERSWYRRAGRVGPRNAAAASVAELRLVAGLELLPDSVLEGLIARDAYVSLNHAPQAVIEALPGIGPRLAARVVARRLSGRPLRSALELEELVAPQEREELERAWPALLAVAVAAPESWLIRMRIPGVGGRADVQASARVVLSGHGTHVLEWVPE